jgi:hypothetical protein
MAARLMLERNQGSRIWCAFLLTFLIWETGCSKNYVRPENLIYILNNTNTEIRLISYEPCETPGSGRTPIATHRPIRPGETLTVPPLKGCVDLIAIDIEGDVIGHQREVRMQPGMVWRINR